MLTPTTRPSSRASHEPAIVEPAIVEHERSNLCRCFASQHDRQRPGYWHLHRGGHHRQRARAGGVGSELHLNEVLAELSSAETIVDVQRHEMTSAEPIEFGPIYDIPGASEEDDERPLDDDEYE